MAVLRDPRRLDSAIDTSEIGKEVGARVREELDYRREAKHAALYRAMLADVDIVRVPRAWPELLTGRLLMLDLLDLEGKTLTHRNDPLEIRNALATAMFTAWWFPFSRFGVIHGDPHLGNYTVFARDGAPAGINLLDYGCIRIFPPKDNFVRGVVDLYHGLLRGDDDLVVHAYETWGFRRLSRDLIDTLNIWARFIYGPLLDDRVRSIAYGVKPSEYGRREAFRAASGAQAERPGDGAARIRVHGSRRDRARRRVPAPARRAEFLSSVQRSHRAVHDGPRRQAPSRRAQGCGLGGNALAAIAIDAFEPNQRVLHEGRRQVVLDHVGERLEDLEVMPPGGGPEYQVGFDRRAAGDAAGHLRHHDRLVVGERKARARPVAHPIERGACPGLFLLKPSIATYTVMPGLVPGIHDLLF